MAFDHILAHRENGMETIKVERRDGGVLRIALDRPQVLNAIDRTMRLELEDALKDAIADPSVRSIVLASEGPHFSAGGDIGFMQGMDADAIRSYHRDILGFVRLLAGSPKPTVALVRGACAGGAVGFAMCCDYLIASTTAYFSLQFMRIGLVPDMGALYFLAQRVGAQKMRRIILEDRIVRADEADELGLCDKLIDDALLDTDGLAIAQRLGELAPQAFRQTKWLIRRTEGDFERFLDDELTAANPCVGGPEFIEGSAAFFEKRKPRF
jgi:enoyl-CoA hydratase/carnithine racemase